MLYVANCSPDDANSALAADASDCQQWTVKAFASSCNGVECTGSSTVDGGFEPFSTAAVNNAYVIFARKCVL
jgi:hypothetical protein